MSRYITERSHSRRTQWEHAPDDRHHLYILLPPIPTFPRLPRISEPSMPFYHSHNHSGASIITPWGVHDLREVVLGEKWDCGLCALCVSTVRLVHRPVFE